MRNTLKDYLRKAEINKKQKIRSLAVLLILSIVVSGNVFWLLRQTGLTLAGDAMCGCEEHTHSEGCYSKTLLCELSKEAHIHSAAYYQALNTDPVLICTLREEPHIHADECYAVEFVEGYEQQKLICTITEEDHEHAESCYTTLYIEGSEAKTLICEKTVDPHAHTDACYETAEAETEGTKALICELSEEQHTHTDECYANTLICTKTEHVHSLECYSDETADVESQLDWQEMFGGYPTGDLRADLVSIAKSQIGYAESERNFEVDSDGVRRGYTRYGAWYGAPYGDWSAMFVSFCLNYAGSDSSDTPYNIGADTMKQLWIKEGRFAEPTGYSPEYGDLIFFADNTVGVVASVHFDVLTVVCGDIEDEVVEQDIMDYDESIVGYGILELPELLTADGLPVEAKVSDIALETCDCGNEALPATSHADICAYKSQLKTIAGDYTADELYAVWSLLPADAQEYILQYLTDNAWKYGTKAEDLKVLISEGGSGEGNTTDSCGGATFSVSGDIPETATLQVSDPEYTEAQKMAYVNPNIQNHVNWSMVYDISIMNGGVAYTPDLPVTVSVELPTLASADYDPETMFFYVVHLDEATGKELSKERVEVVDNTITFTATSFSPYLFYSIDMESEGGERILGTNWMELRDSGVFTYWEQFLTTNSSAGEAPAMLASDNGTEPSDTQIDNWGGTTESEYGDGVEVSKTIDGTDIENVFDITLTVKTQESITEIYEEPDMAVVIVMDISHTMNENFGNTTRYEAAVLAAENFIDNFAAQSGELSRIGYVAFNTDGHEIFGLSSCATTAEATALKNEMRQETGAIIDADGYDVSHSRFTNIEAGLKMGYDMLASAPNEHKYIIFLSDGFPTTYLNNATTAPYDGYDPYTSSGTKGADGVFYDYITGYYCSYGTSYSDKAAIRAREQATAIKNSGATIFTIGVDVGGHTIAGYDGRDGLSVIDRTGTSYEIGDASSTSSYVNWLRSSIGSEYYYDSTNAGGLQDAYDTIFKEILRLKEESSEADWVAQDPLPLAPPEYLEFIGFYDQSGTLLATDEALSGFASESGENTATYAYNSISGLNTINWDLKDSGYTKTESGGVTTYSYQLVYRVRLKNEADGFIENNIYNTNAPTFLTYRVFESENGTTTLSEQRMISFEIPAVHGYLAELTFQKKDSYGHSLEGAEFKLSHNSTACPICRGDDENHVEVPSYTAISKADGTVSFIGIPSGHSYTLQEVKAPPGYVSDGKQYTIVVAYDTLTMDEEWTGTIVNKTGAEFPSTGGPGTLLYLLTGGLLIATSVVFGYIHRRKREWRGEI